MNNFSFVFFGTDPLAKDVLEALEKKGMLPKLIVAGRDTLDRAKNPVFPTEKSWAIERNIPVLQPEKINQEFITELSKETWDVFIVASYGKILPDSLLSIPKKGVINLHPSLLPRLRGPSPMRTAILNDIRETGVSIMLLDKELDHGPLLAQKQILVTPWPMKGSELDKLLAKEGAELLADILPKWIKGEVEVKEQDHTEATYCSEFTKEDGLLDLNQNAYKNYLKICALDGWPGTYFFAEKNEQKIRVKITDAVYKDNTLTILKVIPEGKKEMSYIDFVRGLK